MSLLISRVVKALVIGRENFSNDFCPPDLELCSVRGSCNANNGFPMARFEIHGTKLGFVAYIFEEVRTKSPPFGYR